MSSKTIATPERPIQQKGLPPTNYVANSKRAHYGKLAYQRKEIGQLENSSRTGSPSVLVAGSKSLSDHPSIHAIDDIARFSSLSQSQTPPQVYPCRWSWCRLIFDTNSCLVHHVIHDHVHTAVPVRRDEIPIYRRVEEGIGESLTLSGLGLSAPNHNMSSESKPRAAENSVDVEPTSSLPSPPASSPTSLSFAAYEDERQHPSDAVSPTRYNAHSPSPEAPLHRYPPPLNLTHAVVRGSIAPEPRQTPPTFASLSSPIDPPFDEMFVDPPTPTFDSLVESAIGANRSKPEANHIRHSPSHQLRYSETQGSQESSASSNSYESAEKQLTQSMDVDDHNNICPDARRVSLQEAAPGCTALGVLSNQTPLQVTPMRVRQAWYGTRPARNIASPLADGSRSTLGKGFGLRSAHSTLSQAQKVEIRVEARPEHAFRSGTLQITPTASPSKENGGSMVYAEQPQTQSSTQSESQSHDGSLEYVSYPPLQTQAPYWSQSLSQ